MQVSIIVPVLNEQASLQSLYDEIASVARESKLSCEVIFVDDGSRDDSWSVIKQLAKSPRSDEFHPGVSGIRLRRNFGKAAALTAGFAAANGDHLAMLDADLQDDPREIPKMLAALAPGVDVVNGWKRQRHDPWHKVYPSWAFNWMVSRLTGLKLHDHNCGLKVFRRDVINEVQIYGELHRFIPVLAHARGFGVRELEVRHRPRQFGHSKYGVQRFLRGFLDLLTVSFLTTFGQRPLHVLGACGLVFFAIGAAGLTWLAALWLATNVAGWQMPPIGRRPMLAYSIAVLLLGGQLLTLGLLAELIVAQNVARNAAGTSADVATAVKTGLWPGSRQLYSVMERVGSERTSEEIEN